MSFLQTIKRTGQLVLEGLLFAFIYKNIYSDMVSDI